MRTLWVAWLVLWTAGCGATGATGPAADPAGGDAGSALPEVPDYDMVVPAVESVSPGEVTLGDTLRVFGEGFLSPDYGTMRIVFEGKYFTEDGEELDYRGDFPLTVRSPGVAELDFDHLFFSPTAGKLGSFHGSVQVISRLDMDVRNAEAGTERTSSRTATSLRVRPSIDVTKLRTVDKSGCAPVTDATTMGANLELEVRALGLGEATPEDPIMFRVGFQSPTLQVQYVKEDVYHAWPLDLHPGLEDTVYVDAPEGQNTMTFVVEQGESLLIDPTWQRMTAQVNPSVQIAQENHREVLLGKLAAGSLDGDPGPMSATLTIQAERASGAGPVVTRPVMIDIWNEWEILPYDGNQRLLERYPAEVPSGGCGSCTSGGDIGRELSYTEGESVSRSRSISMRWDVNVANTLGLQLGRNFPQQSFFNASSTWSSTFGVDVSESVSTETHQSLNLTAHVLPGFYGLCYRQLSRYERTVEVVYHNACGASDVVGKAALTDWGWGFDVATGRHCPPRTNLPPAQRFE